APVAQPVHRMPCVLGKSAVARRTLKFVYFLSGCTVVHQRELWDSSEFTKAIQVALRIGGQVFVPSEEDRVAAKRIKPSPQVRCVLIAAIDMRPAPEDFIK